MLKIVDILTAPQQVQQILKPKMRSTRLHLILPRVTGKPKLRNIFWN